MPTLPQYTLPDDTATAAAYADALSRVSVVVGDIAELPQAFDVIVNAANRSLLGGGGVDGALHRAAGPELLRATRALGGCATGEAKSTPAFRLNATWAVHAVAPIWEGGVAGEDDLLARAYRSALRESVRLGARNVALPLLGTGAYGYPRGRAAMVAALTVTTCAALTPGLEVTFVAFSEDDARVQRAALACLAGA